MLTLKLNQLTQSLSLCCASELFAAHLQALFPFWHIQDPKTEPSHQIYAQYYFIIFIQISSLKSMLKPLVVPRINVMKAGGAGFATETSE